MKILKILSFILVVFIFSSCQKCTECTNENLLGGGNGDGIDIEIEVCEDDFENGGLYIEDPILGGIYLNSKEDYVTYLEARDYNCYTNIW